MEENKTIWHNLRKKPQSNKDVLVETYDKKMPLRVVYIDSSNVWHSSNSWCRSYQNSKEKPRGKKNDFRVKRWAYIEDVLTLWMRNLNQCYYSRLTNEEMGKIIVKGNRI